MSCVVREVAWRAPACGSKAAPRPSGRTPICESHLCRYGRSGSSRRCFELPLRLVYSVRDSGGLLPDDTESFFCADHDRYACRATIEDGTRCPEERRSGTEYCRAHAESVCQAKNRGGSSCRSVAMHDADYCEVHRCANGIGGRGPEGHCRNLRRGGSSFCDDHICIWRGREGQRCDKQSPHLRACCVKHTCARPSCDFGSEDAASHCIYHLCAWGRRGKSKEWPPCGESVENEGYCDRHAHGRDRRVEVEAYRPRSRRREEVTPVEYLRGEFESDTTTDYMSDPEYRPTIAIPRVPKTTRSGSQRLMKRLEFRSSTPAGTESRGSYDSRNEWTQELTIRPWRPYTPF